MSQSLPTLRILHTKFGLIWSASWPDKKRPIFKIPYLKKSQIFVRQINFFPGQAIQKILFALHFHYTVDSQYKVGSLWKTRPNEISLFLKIEKVNNFDWNMKFFSIFKIPFLKKWQIFVRQINFFPGQAIQKILFALHFHYTADSQYKVGPLWTTRPNEISLFLKIEKVDIFDWNMNFFSMKVRRTILFVSESIYPEDTPYKFGLIWSASWPDKKDLFLKFLFWKNGKFSYDKLIFFLGKLYKKFCLLYTFIILLIPNIKLVHFEQLDPMKFLYFWK